MTFPFLKKLLVDLGIFYIPFVAVVVVGSSNAGNLTDGLDGLAIGAVGIAAGTYGILAYVTGNAVTARYLQIPYIAQSGELAVFCGALVGASLGFLSEALFCFKVQQTSALKRMQNARCKSDSSH